MPWIVEESKRIEKERILKLTEQLALATERNFCKNPKKVLLLPPDITRAHSGAGWITNHLYHYFAKKADVHLIPTLGQHVPHTQEQNKWMFGDIPEEKIHVHDWRNGVVKIGEIPASYVKEVSKGKADWPIPVSVNKMLIEEKWDIIINIGHIVPHEVLGFANHNKNYFIGLGGKEMICASHMMAACCGIENNLGRLITPLRDCYNKAEKEYLSHLPDAYLQVVMAYDENGTLCHTGFYAGEDLETYLVGARASQKQNITIVPPLKKVVAIMQGDEFYSTWVANKAIYRTRMAMADGGQLIIIAPGLKRFGEQEEVDKLIRKYGYCGTEKVMKMYKIDPLLQDLTHGTAHLIHGSSEGRFTITYAPGQLSEEEIRSVCFDYMDINEALSRYNPKILKNGFNKMPDGEEIYFISTPSAGLWSVKEKIMDNH
ncbi:MAG TPA: lactate racemase domain-containing protein [Victivallales bacterium]|nr:lactate racemase domain-containing protein [Victivallales bacterium]HPO90129.1 lactate racemase domain-containing protein [Victivallales bacterium]HRR06113.1 lactate racemase domain-containing protein [Victivallales bacterium]HRR28429.1 lactate racemase domain-containing protein [Victivallales bacterium]HRU00529.1 lactate racemase domain-containing protein [Victivallales bacterium]